MARDFSTVRLAVENLTNVPFLESNFSVHGRGIHGKERVKERKRSRRNCKEILKTTLRFLLSTTPLNRGGQRGNGEGRTEGTKKGTLGGGKKEKRPFGDARLNGITSRLRNNNTGLNNLDGP